VAEALPVIADVDQEIGECALNLGAFAGAFDHPQRFERLAALSLGGLGLQEVVVHSRWPHIDAVDAIALDPAETVKRTTFGQDTADAARQFRRDRYVSLERFSVIRQNANNYPKRMSPFLTNSVGFTFDLPYSNLRAPNGKPGTGIYLHNGNENVANMIYTRLQKHLQLLPEGRVDIDHVVVWYPGAPEPGAEPVVKFPPDTTPHVTDHPKPAVSAITNG
jgi:hypothetical protein